MTMDVRPAAVDADVLRSQISDKYSEVAQAPEKGFHFHTGRPLARMVGYPDADIDALPRARSSRSPVPATRSRSAA